MIETIPTISEVIGKQRIEVEAQIKQNDILGHTIRIDQIIRMNGMWGEYFLVFGYDCETKQTISFIARGKVVMEKMAMVLKKNIFPVMAKIEKKGKYYTIV